MAPFFASLFAFMTIGEKMSTFEIVMMFMSFGAVVMVALSQGSASEDEDMDTEIQWFGNNTKLAGIVGCCAMVLLSIANGILSVLTRIL